MSPLEPVLRPITRARLQELAESGFGDMIKAVVDCGRREMVVGGELHADEDLWGINLYPADTSDDWIEFDSMINIRPSQGNPGRSVESQETQTLIRSIVAELVQP